MLNAQLFSDDELPALRKIVLFYCAVGENKPPATDFRYEAIDRLKFPQIRFSLLPVLRKTECFDFEKAKVEVKKFLVRLLTLTGSDQHA